MNEYVIALKGGKEFVNMGKYVYMIGNEVVNRATFVKFIAEECEPQVTYCCGFGIESGDYKKGEAVTKRMQREAYYDYKKSLEWGRPSKCGDANAIYCGARTSSLRVEYHPQ